MTKVQLLPSRLAHDIKTMKDILNHFLDYRINHPKEVTDVKDTDLVLILHGMIFQIITLHLDHLRD